MNLAQKQASGRLRLGPSAEQHSKLKTSGVLILSHIRSARAGRLRSPQEFLMARLNYFECGRGSSRIHIRDFIFARGGARGEGGTARPLNY